MKINHHIPDCIFYPAHYLSEPGRWINNNKIFFGLFVFFICCRYKRSNQIFDLNPDSVRKL
jgi:hypothetical protein